MPDTQAPTFPKWQSHKIVEAFKINRIYTDDSNVDPEGDDQSSDDMQYHLSGDNVSVTVGDVWMNSRYQGSDEDQGYYVRYPDGYESWSPSKSFEEGYDSWPPTNQTEEDVPDPVIGHLLYCRLRDSVHTALGDEKTFVIEEDPIIFLAHVNSHNTQPVLELRYSLPILESQRDQMNILAERFPPPRVS